MKNCVVNFVTKEIIVSKKFLKKAESFHSEEYNEMLALMNELPNFTIKTKEVCRRNCKSMYKGLTYAAMRKYLMMNSSEHLETFEQLMNYGCSYFQVREWFLRTCPYYPSVALGDSFPDSYIEIAA